MAPRKKKATAETKAAPKTNGAAPPKTNGEKINMTDEAVNEYLASIAKGEVQLRGMESDVAEKFRATTHQSQQLAQAVQQLASQLEQGRAQQQQLAGELRGYATLLVSAEDARRKKPEPKGGANEETKQPDAGAPV